jgi:DNA-binding SARP family transcriptional activator
VRICVLGACRVIDLEGAEVELGSRKPRSIVAALALTPGRPVPVDTLADLVWGGEPPRTAQGSLHAYLSGLRSALEPDRPSRGSASVIETTDHGYVLRTPTRAVDAHAFADEVGAAGRVLAPLATQFEVGPTAGWPTREEVAGAVDRLDDVLATWGGEPYADLPDHPDVLAARSSLERLRAAAEEARLLGLLAVGDHAGVLATTESATARNPMGEALWATHALALVRAGRQADALEALRTVRATLVEELGVDPGSRLRALEAAVLRQAPEIEQTLTAPVVASARPTSVADAMPVASVHADGVRGEPTVGREGERAVLAALLDQAADGRFTSAQVVGEPGIGKTRLATDLAARARERGFAVAWGHCSPDDGAPPLWPWRAVLEALGDTSAGGDQPPPEPDATPAQVAFARWDGIVRRVLAAATSRPLLLLLEDLHWADEATLRTLAHLLASAPSEAPLCVVGTRRAQPDPAGALALVGEAFARRHAARVDVAGLERAGTSTLLAGLAGGPLPDSLVDAWHARSGGNPFFLVELARLGQGDPDRVPPTVREVVTRRLALLPDRARETLVTAAVTGHRFRPEVVAAANGLELDDVADDLDAARVADLVVDEESGLPAFAHALTRDAVYLSESEHRRARRHGRVARALESDPVVRRLVPDPELTAELAQHWLRAGTSNSARAWRAARAAAAQARSVWAHTEAMQLRTAAVEAHRRAADGVDRERYDLLLELATDAAYAGRWTQVEEAASEATGLGRALGSPALVGAAASTLSRYCVWIPHDIDVVMEDVVDDLRWALAHAPDDDPATRCRLQLSLAVELYYVAESSAERRALIDTGLALARRVADPELTWWAMRTAWMASWAPPHLAERRGWSEEGLAAARAAGDPAAEAVLLVSLAVDELELGRVDVWEQHTAAAVAIARRERLPYVMFTVHWLRMTMAAMGGDRVGVAEHVAGLETTSREVALPMAEVHAPAAAMIASLWDGTVGETVGPMLAAFEDSGQIDAPVHQMLARAGRLDDLRRLLPDSRVTEHDPAQWSQISDWCMEAEAAAAVADVDLARRSRAALAPYADRISLAGAAASFGPVSGYLALAAATTGDREAAGQYATAALDTATRWGWHAYVAWLDEARERLGF